MKNLWRNYNLAVVLGVLFLLSWIAQGIAQWVQAATASEFIWEFLAATFENWQSEFLQLFTMVVLTAFLVHKGSGEGKQNQEQADRTEQKIDMVRVAMQRLQQHMTRVEQAERNRRILAQETADHTFEPFAPEDTSGMAVCARSGCILPKIQHPTFVEST